MVIDRITNERKIQIELFPRNRCKNEMRNMRRMTKLI